MWSRRVSLKRCYLRKEQKSKEPARQKCPKNFKRIFKYQDYEKKERKSWKKSERSILKKDQSGQSTLCGDVIGINAEGRHRLGKSRAKNQCKEQMKFYMLSLHV